jgi:hypothetical protein
MDAISRVCLELAKRYSGLTNLRKARRGSRGVIRSEAISIPAPPGFLACGLERRRGESHYDPSSPSS